MACECNYVMLSVCIILFVAVAAQTLSFALPGWERWSPVQDVIKKGTPPTLLFKANATYTSGLWVECEESFKNCGDWIERSLNAAKEVAKTGGECINEAATGGDTKICRKYTNYEITLWVTETIGLMFLVIGLVCSIIASMIMCCGDCCVGFCKFFVLLICMLAAMSITVGVVVFGVGYAEDTADKTFERNQARFDVDFLKLYYSFALAVVAAGLALLAAIIAAFSTNDDGKP